MLHPENAFGTPLPKRLATYILANKHPFKSNLLFIHITFPIIIISSTFITILHHNTIARFPSKNTSSVNTDT